MVIELGAVVVSVLSDPGGCDEKPDDASCGTYGCLHVCVFLLLSEQISMSTIGATS
jgi:hypothetical protein